MKGQRYVPMDFGGPTAAATGETRIIRAEPLQAAPERDTAIDTAPSYTPRTPARRNNGLWVAGPIALAALAGGALWAASANRDEPETIAASTDTTLTTTTAAAQPVEATPVTETASAAAAMSPASTAAPVARVQRTETRTVVARAAPRPAESATASSASDSGADASGAAVDLTSEAAGSGELPAGPQPYSPSVTVQEPAPVEVEAAPTSPTPPLVTEDVAPVAP